jgi:hypothetical protein
VAGVPAGRAESVGAGGGEQSGDVRLPFVQQVHGHMYDSCAGLTGLTGLTGVTGVTGVTSLTGLTGLLAHRAPAHRPTRRGGRDKSVTEECGYAEPARIWAGDHLTVVTVGFARGQVCLTYPVLVNPR